MYYKPFDVEIVKNYIDKLYFIVNRNAISEYEYLQGAILKHLPFIFGWRKFVHDMYQ